MAMLRNEWRDPILVVPYSLAELLTGHYRLSFLENYGQVSYLSILPSPSLRLQTAMQCGFEESDLIARLLQHFNSQIIQAEGLPG